MYYDYKVTGRVILKIRKKRGLTQEVVSGFANISRSHLAMIENGTVNPKVETLWRIAEALGMRFSELMRLVEDETS